MARYEGLPPPPMKGGRGGPQMEPEKGVSTRDLMAQLVGGNEPTQTVSGRASEAQSAQLVMAGAQQLIQAAQMNPMLAQPIQQALGIIESAIRKFAPPQNQMGGQEQPTPTPKKKPPAQGQPPEGDESAMM